MTDFQASPLQHQVESDKNVEGAFNRRGDYTVKLIARRDDLYLGLAGELGYGSAGVLGWNIELPDLSIYRRDPAQRSNRNRATHKSTNPVAPHAPSFFCTLGG